METTQQGSAGRVELDLERRGGAGGQGEGRLAEPDGGPVVLSRASDDQAAATLVAYPLGYRRGSTVVWRPAAPR